MFDCIEVIAKDVTVPILTVRNVPDDVHRALRVRAALHGRSTEAEVREILANAVKPEQRIRMGDALAALSRDLGLCDQDIAALEAGRDRTPAEPLRLDPAPEPEDEPEDEPASAGSGGG